MRICARCWCRVRTTFWTVWSGQRFATVGTEVGGARGEEREEASSDRGSAKARRVAASIVGEWRSLRAGFRENQRRQSDLNLALPPGTDLPEFGGSRTRTSCHRE